MELDFKELSHLVKTSDALLNVNIKLEPSSVRQEMASITAMVSEVQQLLVFNLRNFLLCKAIKLSSTLFFCKREINHGSQAKEQRHIFRTAVLEYRISHMLLQRQLTVFRSPK